jgi:hypothetical protein
MRRVAAITFGVVLAVGVLGLSGQAQAADITHPNGFFDVGGGIAQLKLSNFESAFATAWDADTSTWGAAGGSGVDGLGNPTGEIVVGDYLRGIFTITSSSDEGAGNQRTPDGFELTGVFSALVSRVVGISGGKALFELTPDSGFEADFGSGAMTAFFYDTAPDFSAFGSLASTVANASDGSLYMTLGADGTKTWGSDYYWAAVGSATPGIATFSASVALLTNNTGISSTLFEDLTQQPPVHSEGSFSVTDAVLNAILNDFGLQGNTEINTNGSIPWQLKSEDPLSVHVTPLPAASSLGAAMLLGLLGLGVRRSRRRAA